MVVKPLSEICGDPEVPLLRIRDTPDDINIGHILVIEANSEKLPVLIFGINSIVKFRLDFRSRLMIVRKAKSKDLPDLCRLSEDVHNLHFSHDPSFFQPFSISKFRKYFADVMKRKECILLVAEAKQSVIGYALLEVQNHKPNPMLKRRRFLYLDQVCVDPAYRRKGVAKQLVRFALKKAASNGFSQVVLDVWDFNKRAQKFFGSMKFSHQIHRMVQIVD